MNDAAKTVPRPGLLTEPSYGYRVGFGEKPTLKQILVEWVDAVSFWKNRSRLLPAFYAAYHLATFVVFIAFFIRFPSLISVLYVMAVASGIATIFNTIWYHRYCTHRAFKFRSIWFARAFLWVNPVCFREESYVIPHRIHHSKSDQPGDPYGPHLGWLGSYLATESQQKINLEITRSEYDKLTKSLEHIGFVKNSYEQFQLLGSVENLWHYLARVLVATLFWNMIAYAIAGWHDVLAWISGVFFYSLLVRDFNFRGHGGFLGEHHPGAPLNQVFYGLIAGEWHENHHAFPRSAKCGLTWWQLDIPYWFIKLLAVCGVVVQVNQPHKQSHAVASVPQPV